MEYSESELLIPALKILKEKNRPVTTSELIEILASRLKPTGKDTELLTGRHDTHFSQKVRNLKSHDTLERKGVAEYKDGSWIITEKGVQYLGENEPILKYLKDQNFSNKEVEKEIKNDFQGIIIEEVAINETLISEGKSSIRSRIYRQRSKILRTAKLQEIKTNNNGIVACIACSFNFDDFYGTIGKDYIEIHHLSPVHEMDLTGERFQLNRALKKVVLVCSNCHRMIHRKKDRIIGIDQLKEMIVRNNN